ncbi:hypothetical protein AAFF_G00150630 [Aldrovandia affinis]|uniref:Uncharacterized protein n=1 Tax=Aldrovandia affinis TaxID=143900 RepID=A0AAD7W8G0_9TELE|nr:hypothetical protein AAFF_G00150630 [Aldrovandia affinis]
MTLRSTDQTGPCQFSAGFGKARLHPCSGEGALQAFGVEEFQQSARVLLGVASDDMRQLRSSWVLAACAH